MSEDSKDTNTVTAFTEKVKKLVDENIVNQALSNNEVEFSYKEKTYRIRKLTYLERQELYQKRMDKYLELLEAKDETGNFKYKSEEDLRKLYKARGVDIDSIENKLFNLDLKKKEFQKKLGAALATEEGKKEAPEADLLALKEEIENITVEIQALSIKKNSLLEFSIEAQTFIFMMAYATALATEIKEGEEWKRVWNKYQDFIGGEEGLINKSTFYATVLISSEVNILE